MCPSSLLMPVQMVTKEVAICISHFVMSHNWTLTVARPEGSGNCHLATMVRLNTALMYHDTYKQGFL